MSRIIKPVKKVVGLLLLMVASTCMAVIVTQFIDVNTYVKRGKDIVIAKCLSVPIGPNVSYDFGANELGDGLHFVEVDVLKRLKGTNQFGKLTIATIYPMTVGRTYLLYSLGGLIPPYTNSAGVKFPGTDFLAVPELSVVELPPYWDIKSLDNAVVGVPAESNMEKRFEQAVTAQVSLIFKQRLAYLKSQMEGMEMESKLLEQAQTGK